MPFEMRDRLSGRVVVIAGASTGIGRASAIRVAREGAKVVVGSPAYEQELINSLVHEIVSAGGSATGTAFDATDEASIQKLTDTAKNVYGGVDAFLANFADMRAILQDSDAADVSFEILQRTIDVNLVGMFRATRSAIPALLERGGGAMIYMSSVASMMGDSTRPCYAVAKSGLNALMRHVASRWGMENIRANAILPGFVVTAEREEKLAEATRDRMLRRGRSPRLGTPDDIAAMVAMLASRDGDWINGQCITVDGGSVLR